MRADLLPAQASIDWAVAQFPSFRDRIHSWLHKNIYVAIENPDPNVPNDVVVAVEKEPFPLSFMVEAGAYINAIRSSLDILAYALAVRHGVPKPDDCYFPVATSEKVFLSGGYKGAEFVKGLPQDERAKIESLKPYQGGNNLLWAIHRLDIVRKHKRLIEPAIRPQTIVVSGWGLDLSNMFTPIGAHVSVHDKTVLGFLAKARRDDPKIDCTPFVAFNEPNLLGHQPVIAALREFASLANSIIALFDIP
jgi:hypothetical protein